MLFRMTYSCIEWADIYFTYEQFKSYQLKRNHFRLYIYMNLRYLLLKKNLYLEKKEFSELYFFDYT